MSSGKGEKRTEKMQGDVKQDVREGRRKGKLIKKMCSSVGVKREVGYVTGVVCGVTRE